MERAGDPAILREEVNVKRSGDPTDLREEKKVLWDVVQDMVQEAAKGIDFVEEGAPAIDEHMTEAGFHMSIHVDEETGFVVGGNVSVVDCLHRSGGIAARGWTRWAPTTMAVTRTAVCPRRTDRRASEG